MADDMNAINIFNNPWKKYRLLKTMALFSSFMSLGLAYSLLGPTVVSMEILLDTDTKTISAAFSGAAIGYLSGAVVCGVVYKFLHKELLFAIATFSVAVATGLAPFSWNLYIFVAACAIQGFFMAVIDTGGQSYVLKLWEGHRHKEPILQAAHGIWSLGATIGPFIVRPFLVDLRNVARERSNTSNFMDNGIISTFGTDIENDTSINITDYYGEDIDDITMTTELPFNSTIGEDELKVRVGYIRYAYVTIAALILICSSLFMVSYSLMRPSRLDKTQEKTQTDKEKSKYTKSYRRFRITLLVFMFFFYFTNLWVEGVPGSYLAAFVVKELQWPNNYGALAVSTYWGAHGLGRVLGIPIASCVSPRNMLIGDMTLTVIGFALLLFVKMFEHIIWIGVIIGGLGMGTIFASAILWLEGHMEVTGAASSVLLTAASLGGIVSPILTGYLFDEVSHMCFIYVILTASICESIIFIGTYFFALKYGGSRSKRKASLQLDRSPSKEEPVEMKHLTKDDIYVVRDGLDENQKLKDEPNDVGTNPFDE